jgi:hypothetical protein
MLSIYLFVVMGLLSPAAAQSPTNFTRLVKGSPVIAVGKIIEIGKPPAMWSAGGFVVAQKVKYEVSSVLKGEGLGGEITVHHFLFKGTPNSEKDRSALSPDIFGVGKEYILFIHPFKSDGEPDGSPDTTVTEFYEVTSSQPAVPATEANLGAVRKLLPAP